MKIFSYMNEAEKDIKTYLRKYLDYVSIFHCNCKQNSNDIFMAMMSRDMQYGAARSRVSKLASLLEQKFNDVLSSGLSC